MFENNSLELRFSNELFYKPLIVAAMMMFSQQLSGINAIFYYSTGIFNAAGVENGPLSTVAVGFVNVVFTGIRYISPSSHFIETLIELIIN